jgi:hypothetical protein
MKNAYERFGKLAYLRRTEKSGTNIRVLLDAFDLLSVTRLPY